MGRNLPAKSGANSGTKAVTNNSLQAKSANCAPAVTRQYLEQNNVSALIETGGLMWQDRSTNNAAYEVPAGSGEFYIYSGGLWMGGLDVNGQLKLAAQKFGTDGRDYWTGPLSTIANSGNPAAGTLDYGAAEIEPDVCAEYDAFFYITKAQVSEFRAWYNCSQDPDCNVSENFPNYSIPNEIMNWPAHGDIGRFQDYFLAPFFDHPNSVQGVYDPLNGDYPWYDLDKEIDCRTERKVTLYGDFTLWWVFNDKGNIHTESGGDPIGMEIRAQAFAFATNDEVNNMTFYNYEMINRSTQVLTETYFAVYVDPDIGYAFNDYVGCDVSRGVGYAYNGTANDVGGNNAIGINPGAIGVDFFEGPYQDNDGMDNPLTTNVIQAIAEGGIPYSGLGVGYGDGTPDNERLGMKRFIYYTAQAAAQQSDPTSQNPSQFYRYMSGLWADGTQLTAGGNGYGGSVSADYAFTGTSDPLNWSTAGTATSNPNWTEFNEGNQPGDRRFVQSAGPFTLEPGAINNITTGVIFGKTKDGDPFNSVKEMLKADDKAQLLFDNCFRIVDGPSAPDLTIQEMDQEIILYLTNPLGSNNHIENNEDYAEKDNAIIPLSITTNTSAVYDSTTGQYNLETNTDSVYNDQYYRFQGYKIYQLKNADVGPDALDNINLARLVAQCDIKDDVATVINYEFDESLGKAVPVLKAEGENNGIRHSFKITEDKFALGNTRLINHKKYYYLAIAYGHNEYLKYEPTYQPDGQQKPYLGSRNTANGGALKPKIAIPHIVIPEAGGTHQLVGYGYGPEITRVEGSGNGGIQDLELTAQSEAEIVTEYTPKRVTYKNTKGPVDIKVIDPLNVKKGNYTLRFYEDSITYNWMLIRSQDDLLDTIFSENTIAFNNEQLIPEWGISVNIKQYFNAKLGSATSTFYKSAVISSRVIFKDSSLVWLSGVKDTDGPESQNWIASGTTDEATNGSPNICEDIMYWNDRKIGIGNNQFVPYDEDEEFEKIIDGTWAPFSLVRKGDCHHSPVSSLCNAGYNQTDLGYLSSVDIVFTSDKSKWTRVPVLETQDYSTKSKLNTTKGAVRLAPSRDKQGKKAGDSGYNSPEGDLNGTQPLGMSWFPGYAIDLETGERLNMAFGEDSWLCNENGCDMLFNPTSRMYDIGGEELFGGKHYVYIFKNDRKNQTLNGFINGSAMPAYDEGDYLYTNLCKTNVTASSLNKVWKSCIWVGTPMLSTLAKGTTTTDPFSYIETEARIQIRVTNSYKNHSENHLLVTDVNSLSQSENNWNPLYEFNMEGISTELNNMSMADSTLNLMNVVPNPYYAYSNYEFNRLDNVVKIVNLPEQCNVNIYNINGTLIKTFKKDNPITSVDWNLENNSGIPIASGMYLIHIVVPGIGERVLKWHGVVRQVDLDSF
jgi:hypothetical protein